MLPVACKNIQDQTSCYKLLWTWERLKGWYAMSKGLNYLWAVKIIDVEKHLTALYAGRNGFKSCELLISFRAHLRALYTRQNGCISCEILPSAHIKTNSMVYSNRQVLVILVAWTEWSNPIKNTISGIIASIISWFTNVSWVISVTI